MRTDERSNAAAKRLGMRLREARHEQGLSTREVARRSGLNQSQVQRIEHGEYASPDPGKVAAISTALGLKVAEVMASANFPLLPDALSPTLYLRAKFRDLPSHQLEALQHEVLDVLARHGIEATDGPAPGEDEDDTSITPTHKKGGTS